MPFIVRNDEQIKVGTTPGLVAGASSFTFDGTGGKPDYLGFDIVISELGGRGILIKDVDYSWDSTTAVFTLLAVGDIFPADQWYNVHFQTLQQQIVVNPVSIVTIDFFIRDINIPNTGNAVIKERLEAFIAKFEPECLRAILGYELYKALITEMSQRIDDLIYGVEYTDYYGKLQKWNGLVHDVNISLIANYIYFYFMKHSSTLTTGVGEKLSKQEAGIAVSPIDKMVNAWNFFVEETSDMVSFLGSKNRLSPSVYTEFTYAQSKITMNYYGRKLNRLGI